MRFGLTLLMILIGSAACKATPVSTAELQLYMDGALVTNRNIIATHEHVLRSRTLLRDVARELNLMTLWQTDERETIDTLNRIMSFRHNEATHSIIVKVRSHGGIDGRIIIDQIGRSHTNFNKGTFDPTPLPRPQDSHPREYAANWPVSTNAFDYVLDMVIHHAE